MQMETLPGKNVSGEASRHGKYGWESYFTFSSAQSPSVILVLLGSEANNSHKMFFF